MTASKWTATQSNKGGNDVKDSDGTPLGDNSMGGPYMLTKSSYVQSDPVMLAANQNFRDADQGLYAPIVYSLGNRIWYDSNNDGIDNDGAGATLGSSTGIAAVRVELYASDASGNPL